MSSSTSSAFDRLHEERVGADRGEALPLARAAGRGETMMGVRWLALSERRRSVSFAPSISGISRSTRTTE